MDFISIIFNLLLALMIMVFSISFISISLRLVMNTVKGFFKISLLLFLIISAFFICDYLVKRRGEDIEFIYDRFDNIITYSNSNISSYIINLLQNTSSVNYSKYINFGR
jgi:hypothetical protein